MAEKFRNKYRVQTTRLFGYDYTRNRAYFITICTQKFTPYFGEIKKGRMNLSETGIIVNDFWFEIPSHFPNAQLDEFIIMPDHIHGIIIIKSKSDSKLNLNYINVETPNLGVSKESTIENVKYETPNLVVSTNSMIKQGNKYWKSNSIGSIINQFKRICTIKVKSCGLDLSWQPRFYDHIIRSDNELDRIRTYIKNNPNNWLNDM
jgi:putative transposase